MEQLTGFTVANRTVEFDIAPTADVLVTIYRVTPTEPLVGWADASVIKALDMTVAQIQQLHIIEENRDWSRTNSVVLEDNVYNMRFHRVINVADPQDPQDVVTKNYMESVQGGFVQQNQALVQQATQQASIATTKAGEASASASAAKTSETNAQKWAESPDSPDNQSDSESPTGETMSAKEWSLYAKQLALNLKNPVIEVSEEDGTVTIAKVNGDTNFFDVVKTVNNLISSNGNVDINRKFYNSYSQLGLSESTVTIQSLVEAMPLNSTAVLYVNESVSNIYSTLPTPTAGEIIVIKGEKSYSPVRLQYIGYHGTINYFSTYSQSAQFVGWKTESAWNLSKGAKGSFQEEFSKFMIQWGLVNVTGEVTDTFQKPFSTCVGILLAHINQSTSPAASVTYEIGYTNTNCKIRTNKTNETHSFFYLAIGYSM